MLYDQWRKVAAEYRSEVALHAADGGSRWTFAQLDTLAERPSEFRGRIAYPQGMSPEFIVAVLRAWRIGQVVCPLEQNQAAPDFPALPRGCVHLKTTSATTGVPRAVAFSEGQLMADTENIITTMRLQRDWPNLGVISLAHSYGFSNLVLPLLLQGIPLILSNSALPEAVRRAAREADHVTLAGVPALWHAWNEAGSIPANTRLAISAGAPLPLTLERATFEATGVKIHNFYGASECGGIAYDATLSPREDESDAGAPMRNVSVAVNEEGCLEVRSGAVGETYWPEPDASLAGGVYRTKDLAELKDGSVCLRGRLSDQINVAGRKVSPETIERELQNHERVRECIVFSVPTTGMERSETIVACVVAQSPVSPEALKQFLLSRLPAWQVPREWIFVDDLAANSRGKISRREWRARFLARRG